VSRKSHFSFRATYDIILIKWPSPRGTPLADIFPVEVRKYREMEKIWLWTRKRKRAIICVSLFLVVLFLFREHMIQFLKSILSPPFNFEKGAPPDDQRSTMWPVIISMTVTLLGSIITTYVFSKDTLDGILDERPYYREVIIEYRRKTMFWLRLYIGFAAISVSLVFVLYFVFYFQEQRFPDCVRIFVFGLCLAIGAVSIFLIFRCIYPEKHLQECAEEQLNEMMSQMKTYTRYGHTAVLLPDVQTISLASWLQIEEESGAGAISYRKFISVFSKWEQLLVLLAQQQPDGGSASMTLSQQIEFTIGTGLHAYRKEADGTPRDSFEWIDARQNGWFLHVCREIIACEESLERSAQTLVSGQRLGAAKEAGMDTHPSALDCFMDEYLFLARYRDLCKVILDRVEDDAQKEGDDPFRNIMDRKRDNGGDQNLAKIFYLFLAGLFTQALRTAPTIRLFFPAGVFMAADFYNIRINDSLFRSSNFQHSIFARAKIKDSNFGLSRFEQCNLYGADCRDCTFTNTFWKDCFLESTLWENVDFTGAELKQCRLRDARFHNIVLQNSCLLHPALGGNDFLDSRLEKIELVLSWNCGHIDIQNCNFSNSILSGIVLRLNGTPKPFSSRFPSLKAEMDRPDLREFLLTGGQKKEDVFSKRMDAFSLPPDLFFPSAGAEVQGYKSVWKDIEKNTAIRMDGSVFQNACLITPCFYRTSLTQSILNGAQMDAARIFGTNLFGCIMPEANLLGSRLWAVVLQSAVLTGAIFFRSRCKLVNFEDAALQNLHASEAEFHGCSFSRSDCSHIDLTRAAIRNSAFADSVLTGAELTGAEFSSVRFDNSVANSMLATYTTFRHCYMGGAGLRGSSFNSAAFEDCNFRLADCSDSVIANVTFKRCSFAGCNFKNTRFISVKIEDCTCLETAEFEGALFINLELKGENRLLEPETAFPNSHFKEI
jgi:uncharacterized protein YjbI with pentapeptide repeats